MDIGGCAGSEPFALRVLGDSMEPEFEDGCVIVIEADGVVKDGSYVLAVVNDEYIFRQLVIEEGRYFLKPLNPAYETVEIPGLEAVKGVIVQKAGTRRRHRKHYV
jgi:SOS-response transcriptional repressor LexA